MWLGRALTGRWKEEEADRERGTHLLTLTKDRYPYLCTQLHSGWELDLILAQSPGQTLMQDSGNASSSGPQVTTALLLPIGTGHELLPVILT